MRLPDEGVLTVPGYVLCRDFRFFAANWNDAAGRLAYVRGPDGMTFSWSVTTSDVTISSALDVAPPKGASAAVVVNGEARECIAQGEWVRIEPVAHGDEINVTFTADGGAQ